MNHQPIHKRPLRRSLTGVVAALVLLSLPATASASFTRSPLPPITGTTGGPFPAFGGGGNLNDYERAGIAVDATDRLWLGLGRYPEVTLERFAPAYAVSPSEFLAPTIDLGPEARTSPGQLTIDHSGGDLFLTGSKAFFNGQADVSGAYLESFEAAGTFLGRSSQLGGPADLAVDNSSEPSAGSVYVSRRNNPVGVEKLNAGLEPVEFKAAKPSPPFYLEGNRIIGAPATANGCEAQLFQSGIAPFPGALTVDAEGNLYVVNPECGHPTLPAVLEYRPSGEFVRAITGEETPGLEGHDKGGWGNGIILNLTGLAFDPVSGHLLVALASSQQGGQQVGAIDEFDAETGRFVAQITEVPGGAPLTEPAQMAVDSHGDLYVSEHKHSVVEVYGPGRFLPSLHLGATSQNTPTGAVLNGSVDPEGLALSDCRFQYVSEGAFEASGFEDLSSGGEAACEAPAAAEIPADSKFHPVHAEAAGLTSGATYRYRLLATSEGALGGSAQTKPLAFTALHAPAVESTSAENISSGFADLHARIDPLGAPTSYQFEYLTEAQYVANGESFAGPNIPALAPAAPASIGSGGSTGSEAVSVRQHLGGLVPGTTYRFRAIAENEIGLAEGPVGTFATLPPASPGLPDGRAYEMLTPPAKGGAQDMFQEVGLSADVVGYPSESGDGFLLETAAGFGPFPGSEMSVYVFSRSAAGWSFKSLASPLLGVQSIYHPAFDPADLSRIAFVDKVGSPPGEAGQHAVGLLGQPGGPYSTLYEGPQVHGGFTDPDETAVVGSRDLSKLVFQSLDHSLAPGAEALDEGSAALYSYAGGQFQLLNVKTNGELLSRCGAELGRVAHVGRSGGANNAVSADGSRIFFTAPDPEHKFNSAEPESTPGCWNPAANVRTPQLYMRSGGETVEVSAPDGVADPTGRHPVAYLGAASDGSRVFFLTETWLTADHPPGHDTELYEWRPGNAAGCEEASPAYVPASKGCLTRISQGESGEAAGEVYAVPAISESGAAVYFTSSAQLTADAPAPGEEFESGQLDLYRYDTATGTTAYVSTVLEIENPRGSRNADWSQQAFPRGSSGNVHPEPQSSWYASPDGRYLLFPTTRELTGYPSAGCRSDAAQYIPAVETGSDGHCEELFRYDSQAAEHNQPAILCLSCNPSGAPPVSHAQFGLAALNDFPAAGAVRAMSDDGAYAFFNTADSLVPQDANERQDVYEWEAEGTGGCESSRGCLHLISSGADPAPSLYLGVSPDGSNVFFGTHSRLVPADTDTAGDLYDARICTSTDPCIQPPPAREGLCEGDACQSPAPAPNDATPGSLTLDSPGNEPPSASGQKPCRKGQVRRAGKCVKKTHKKGHKKHQRAGADRGGNR